VLTGAGSEGIAALKGELELEDDDSMACGDVESVYRSRETRGVMDVIQQNLMQK
jgi:hypothetical protein